MTSTAEATIIGVHPYADKFPMLAAPEMDELGESIHANGLRQPIVITPDGLILDGRNRYAACQKIGITPETVVYEGDDLAEFVIDSNVTRRNMSTGARAMATALVLAEAGHRENGRWRYGAAAEKFQLGKSRLSEAGVILDFKPDLAESVASGAIPFDQAYQQADAVRQSAERDKILERERRRRAKEEAAAEAERNAQIVTELTQAGSKYLPLVESNEMTPAAAWAAHREDTRKEREAAEVERRNAEQQVRSIAAALSNLTALEYPEARDRIRTAFATHGEAAPPTDRSMHDPDRIRALAAWLNTYADELES